jgi:D-aspartate ligase
MVPALVVTGHLNLVRSLARRGVDVWSVEYEHLQTAHFSRYSMGGLRVPHPLHEEERFVEALLSADRRFDGALLIPMFDASLSAISRYKDALSDRYLVAADNWDVTRVYLEKVRTSALARSLDIATPISIRVDSVEAASTAIRSLQPPYIIKPDVTHEFQDIFGSKMFHSSNATELRELCLRALSGGLDVMVQEFIPGPPSSGVVYSGYFADGEPLAETTHGKIRDGPPTYGSPRVAVSRHIPEIVEPGRSLLAATGYTGFACVEFKLDLRDGVYKLMEVNARHNLAGALHVASGVDYPWIQYRHLVHGEVPDRVEAREGVHWVDIQRDVGYSARFLRTEDLTLREFVRPYRRGTVYRTFDWSDPLPFLLQPVVRVFATLRGWFGRLFRRFRV